MSAHTKGPWPFKTMLTSVGLCHKVGLFPGRDEDRPSAACIYVDGIRPGIDDDLPRAQEMLANARLIAAAPEGIAALKAVEKAWLDGLVSHPEFPIRQVRAAIAKAEGRS